MTSRAAISWNRTTLHSLIPSTIPVFAAMAASLFLDGQLGPVSFILRWAAALTVLAVLVVSRWAPMRPMAAPEMSSARGEAPSSGDGSYGAARAPGSGELSSLWGRLRRCIAAWAAVAAALLIVARAPSVPVALIGFIIGLAAIETGPGCPSVGLAPGLIPACLSYIAIRFATDLVSQAGWIADAIGRCGSRYLDSTRGLNVDLSFTALGGPAVGLAVLYLLWSGRRDGGIGRFIAAVVIPLAWFALLPVVTPEVAAGPVAAFSRGAYHGLFWLGAASVVGAFLPGSAVRGGSPVPALRAPSPQRGEGEEGETGPPARSGRWPLVAAGVAAMLAGVCLVGTAYIGPAAGRSVRVYNRGGLDWERPVFGQFGAFSGGMFGLLPVYCRAEGYDFEVIDQAASTSGQRVGPAAPPRHRVRSNNQEASTSPGAAEARRTSGTGSAPERKGGSDGASPSRAASMAKADAPPEVASPPKDSIEPADLEETQILVLINSPKVWDERERRVIDDFVARGGSLLVLGDHTDVFGLMRGFNSLLEPLGIQFRFDSA